MPGDALASEGAFLTWLAALPGAPVVPDWAARVTTLTRPVGDGRFRVAVSVENLSDDPLVTRRVRGEPVQRTTTPATTSSSASVWRWRRRRA